MSRTRQMLSIVAVVLLGLIVVSWSGAVRAQEGTPAAGEAMMAAGTTFDPVTLALGVDVPSPADVVAFRLGLDPGVVFPFVDSDPNGGLLILESGSLVIRVDAPWTVTRAGLAAAMAQMETMEDLSSVIEAQAGGEDIVLESGDSAYIPGNVNGEIRNDGAERAVALVVVIGPAQGMMAEATPEP